MANPVSDKVLAPLPHGDTRWSLVMKACAGSREALQDLTRAYWPVVYSFLRRKGLAHEDAEDITQETFARLLNEGCLAPVNRAKGRFRSFLYACAEHEASHFRERNGAAKRGAHLTFPFEPSSPEDHGPLLLATDPPNEQGFDRAWSRIIVSRALDAIRSDYARLGKSHICELLIPLLNQGTERGDFRIIAEKLGMTEVNARVSWSRFKASFVTRLRAEIAETVANPGDLDAELRHLMQAWLSSSAI